MTKQSKGVKTSKKGVTTILISPEVKPEEKEKNYTVDKWPKKDKDGRILVQAVYMWPNVALAMADMVERNMFLLENMYGDKPTPTQRRLLADLQMKIKQARQEI